MKIDLTRPRKATLSEAGASPVEPTAALAPEEADFAPPAAPMVMPKQQLEAGREPGWLRLPGFGRRMQGQP